MHWLMVMGRKKVAFALIYIPSGSRALGLCYPQVLGALGHMKGQTVCSELWTWHAEW
jgi:hypothetical protein